METNSQPAMRQRVKMVLQLIKSNLGSQIIIDLLPLMAIFPSKS